MAQDLGAADVAAWLQARAGAMQDLLADLVDTDSNSHDHAGVARVFERLAGFFSAQGIASSPVMRGGHAAALCARSGPAGRPVLLLGHCDTVFPTGEAARRPFRVAQGLAYGPGIADMKGGVVINAFVLAALHALRPDLPAEAFFTGDEEIASPFCRPLIEEKARAARAVFNAEPAKPSGNIVTARKGALFMHLDATGVSAHSGANFTAGRSAIETIAQAIVRLHALTDLEAGITVNVGLVRGGVSVNTTAPHAECEIDIRYRTPDQRVRVLAAAEAIAGRPHVEGTTSRLTLKGEFLPLVPDAAQDVLTRAYLDAGKGLGIAIGTEASGGCADSGFTAATGTPTICGLGPVGRHPHTPDEFIELHTLAERAAVLASALNQLYGRV